ncbi:MAG TPA: helix-turn-helix domain-containing protein [Nocardioidaceae bacterium]|nr:helix-turn-helix domain-containing protein [Nocardioidaceae bacterium]
MTVDPSPPGTPEETPPAAEARRRTITDAADLKAIAHPLRLDLLEALTVHGAKTATELAARLGESPSNCSWHLRKLAEHGFVTEVEGVKGRSRPWRTTSEGMSWGKGETDLEPEASAAGHALTDVLLEREVRRLRSARRAERDETPEWREAFTVMQSGLWLTAEEAREVAEQLEALFMTHHDRMRHPERRPEGARLVALVGWLTPWLEDDTDHDTDHDVDHTVPPDEKQEGAR